MLARRRRPSSIRKGDVSTVIALPTSGALLNIVAGRLGFCTPLETVCRSSAGIGPVIDVLLIQYHATSNSCNNNEEASIEMHVEYLWSRHGWRARYWDGACMGTLL